MLKRLYLFFMLFVFAVTAKAQVGKYRSDLSIGVNGGYVLSNVGFNPRVNQTFHGGITGGYQLHLTKALSMDFSLGLGYLNADTEKYDVIDGVRVRGGNETKHWVGPINAGVTLVWKIF